MRRYILLLIVAAGSLVSASSVKPIATTFNR
nr:hypothetical protein [Mucilaginibacter sp. SP1R1]